MSSEQADGSAFARKADDFLDCNTDRLVGIWNQGADLGFVEAEELKEGVYHVCFVGQESARERYPIIGPNIVAHIQAGRLTIAIRFRQAGGGMLAYPVALDIARKQAAEPSPQPGDSAFCAEGQE
jgi:hypothetical protein